MSSSEHADIVVVGAGIVGLCAALYLQRAGRSVTIVDPLPPGHSTSFGNAGFISAGTIMPIALPGIWRNVPKWLLDPKSPLSVSYRYLPTAAPWLLKWIAASKLDTVHAASNALKALHGDTMARFRELLGPEHFPDLIRTEGSVNVFYGDAPSKSEGFIRDLLTRQGVVTTPMGAAELKEMYPEISPAIKRALYFPNNGYTVSPARLTATLARLFEEAGGTLLSRRILRVTPVEGGIELFTNIGDFRAKAVVLAAGAWTGRLLEPLGVKLPMETERGYHLMLKGANITPRLPLLLRDGGMAITPMEDGLRLAGTVEIAGLDAPPNEERALQLLDRARIVFPTLRADGYQKWLGFRPSLPDSVAAIGPAPGIPGLFVAAGHGHTGMVGSSETGRLVRDLVLGAPPAIDPAPYSLARFNRAA